MRPRGYWGLPAFASLSMPGSGREYRFDLLLGQAGILGNSLDDLILGLLFTNSCNFH